MLFCCINKRQWIKELIIVYLGDHEYWDEWNRIKGEIIKDWWYNGEVEWNRVNIVGYYNQMW